MTRYANSMAPNPAVPGGHAVVRQYRALLFSSFFLLFGSVALSGQESKPEIRGPYPARPGETCVVCNGVTTEADVAYVVNGQRVAVKKEFEQEFLAEPERFMRRYRPESMLFTASMPAESNWTLFLAATYVLLGLLFGGLCAQQAMAKGYPGARWFFYGLCANVIAWLLLKSKPPVHPVALPEGLAKLPSTLAPAACPICGRPNHPGARSCSACGAALSNSIVSEAESVKRVNR